MARWSSLNSTGKWLWIGCIINLTIAIILATGGSAMALFSMVVAAYCGMVTFHPKYQYQDANDINNDKQE